LGQTQSNKAGRPFIHRYPAAEFWLAGEGYRQGRRARAGRDDDVFYAMLGAHIGNVENRLFVEPI
jgi:hypothetical protein